MEITRKVRVILTCEHGGHRVPAAYAELFARCGRVLTSHRGWDPGALELARNLSRGLSTRLYSSTITRLLVDLNRSIGNSALFSRYVSPLGEPDQRKLLDRYYQPYRTQVEEAIAAELADTRSAVRARSVSEERSSLTLRALTQHAFGGGESIVVHISVHSFTPVLRGQVRQADIGLLYDPSRQLEKEFCECWRQQLLKLRPELRVRKNYPYLGTSDGFTTQLRRRFGARYLGIELEVNQRWPRRGGLVWRRLQLDVLESLRGAIAAIGKAG